MNGHARRVAYPEQSVPSYPLSLVDQFEPIAQEDIVPAVPADLRRLSRLLAADATVYGLPAAYQYAEMHQQAVDTGSPRYTGFNAFAHDRELASPGYAAFKTPNADTLYSNAWLDLSAGPVLLDIPELGSRYYTVNFLDMYSNATNLSTRTVGPSGGRFLIATPDWDGEVPADATPFRVATRYLWILLRIAVDGSEADLPAARELQDRFTITPVSRCVTPSAVPAAFPIASPGTVRDDWRTFFGAVDFVLRSCGRPDQEDGYTYRFRSIGIGGPAPLDVDAMADECKLGMRAGFSDAMSVIKGCRTQLGNPIPGAYWNRGTAGAYGFNYLRRAVANYVGLGATVPAENQAFTTFRDGTGQQLDGSRHTYRVTLNPPPPVGAFWSLTVYDSATLELVPNEMCRYVINSSTASLRYHPDGSVDIVVSREPPADLNNWLPAPDGPFYLAIRAYLPAPEVLHGPWQPSPVQRNEDDPRNGT